ncbi:hypothetical protein P7C70_g2835, partial [Phenoliferia sp. Uapishka_3]
MPPIVRAINRESVRWVPATPLSDVDVLWLHVGKYFMDLRVFLSGPRKGTMDWSMGGLYLELPLTGIEDEKPIRFINVIDQRSPASQIHPQLPESLINPEESARDPHLHSIDDVIFTPLPSLPSAPGGRSMESGEMPDPFSDESEKYVLFEEIWQEMEVPSKSQFVFLESLGGDGQGKAYVARVANWAMGLMDDNGTYLAWRDELVDGEWKMKYEFGGAVAKAKVPRVEDGQGWEEGSTVEIAGRKWVFGEEVHGTERSVLKVRLGVDEDEVRDSDDFEASTSEENEQEIIIAALTPGQMEVATTNVLLSNEVDYVVFSVSGPNEVHLVGHYTDTNSASAGLRGVQVLCGDSDSEDESDDDMEGVENELRTLKEDREAHHDPDCASYRAEIDDAIDGTEGYVFEDKTYPAGVPAFVDLTLDESSSDEVEYDEDGGIPDHDDSDASGSEADEEDEGVIRSYVAEARLEFEELKAAKITKKAAVSAVHVPTPMEE